MEQIDIFDETGNKIGVAPREEAHARGLIHQVVHVWILSEWKGEAALVFQQRAFDKKDFPGYYDIAVGGHVGAGEALLPSALREMGEEIGLYPTEADLEYRGAHRDDCHIGDFDNREVAHVFLYHHRGEMFSPGPEVARMVWVSIPEYKKALSGAAATARTAMGEKIFILPDQWCDHHHEAERFIFPAVQA